MAYVQAWFWAFLFTQMVEVPIYSVGLRVGIVPALGASAITHPILWFLLFPYLDLPYVWLIVIAESFAVLVEAGYFAWAFRRRRALLWSVLANAASFGTGMLSRALFGAP
jgi:hypothetical protein